MSKYRNIWRESINANKKMSRNLEKGLLVFDKLLKKDDSDGMIFYSRGESYEKHKMYDNALHDYQKAIDLFPLPHWKTIARIAYHRVAKITKIETKKPTEFSEVNDEQCKLIHNIYDFTNIPTFARMLALSAVHRIDSEHDSAFIDFRTCIELFVKELFEDGTDIALRDMLDEIAKNENISSSVIDSMHKLKQRGNKSTHSSPTEITDKEVKYYLSIFHEVLKYAHAEIFKREEYY